jgi:hypothetical protein
MAWLRARFSGNISFASPELIALGRACHMVAGMPERSMAGDVRGKLMNKLLLAKPLIPLALIMLAACDSGSEVKMENASVGEVAQEMRKQGGKEFFVNPGQWQQTITLLEIDAPGMPPEARSMMQKAMDQVQVHKVCLTEAQAKSPKEDFFTGADKNCRYEHFNWDNGKIDLKLNCKHPQATQTMVLTGDYEPNGYVMTMTSETEAPGPMGKMTMKMKVDAKRIGACDGTEAADAAN